MHALRANISPTPPPLNTIANHPQHHPGSIKSIVINNSVSSSNSYLNKSLYQM